MERNDYLDPYLEVKEVDADRMYEEWRDRNMSEENLSIVKGRRPVTFWIVVYDWLWGDIWHRGIEGFKSQEEAMNFIDECYGESDTRNITGPFKWTEAQ